MQILDGLAASGALTAIVLAVVQFVRIILDYCLTREVLRRTPDKQLADVIRALNAGRRNKRK